MSKEKYFENKIKKFLKERGIWYVKYWGGGAFTLSGVPDILACHNGLFLGIELKSSTGRPSALQLVTLDLIRKAGGKGILLYPEDEKQFKAWIVDSCPVNDWYKGNLDKQAKWKARIDEKIG